MSRYKHYQYRVQVEGTNAEWLELHTPGQITVALSIEPTGIVEIRLLPEQQEEKLWDGRTRSPRHHICRERKVETMPNLSVQLKTIPPEQPMFSDVKAGNFFTAGPDIYIRTIWDGYQTNAVRLKDGKLMRFMDDVNIIHITPGTVLVVGT